MYNLLKLESHKLQQYFLILLQFVVFPVSYFFSSSPNYNNRTTDKNVRKYRTSVSIERYQAKKRQPYTFAAFGIGLNFFILTILFQSSQLRQAALFFFGLFILLAVFDLYRLRNRIRKTYDNVNFTKGKSSFRDNLSLAKSYVWNNKYYILATSIGLILALTVIAQAMIVSSSYQQAAFNDYIRGDDPTLFQMRFTNYNETPYNDWAKNVQYNASVWFFNAAIRPAEMVTEGNLGIKIILSTSRDYNLDAHARAAQVQQVTTHTFNQRLFNLYSQLPSYSNFTTDNQSILILPPDIQRVSTLNGQTYSYRTSDFIATNSSGNYFKLLVNSEIIHGLSTINDPYNFHNITYSVDHVWQLTKSDLAYIKYNDLNLPPDFTSGVLFLPPNREWDLLHQLDQAAIDGQKTPYVWGTVGFSTMVFVNLPKLIDMSLIDQIADIQKTDNLLALVQNQFASSHFAADIQYKPAYYLETPLLTLMTAFSDSLQSLQRLLLLFSFPLVMVSLFLLYFSLSAIENKKERIFSQLKIRGTSPNQIRTMLIIEVLFSALIAALVAIDLASYLSRILMKSSGILQFNNPTVPLNYPSSLIWRIPALGILLSLSLNLPNLYKFPNVGIEESMEANIQSEPFWVKHNFDLIIFLISMIFWAFIFFLPISYSSQEFIFASFGGPVLVVTVLAIPLVTGRYFLQVLAKVLLILKVPFDTVNLAIKNLITHKDFTTQLVAVLTAAMMLTFAGLAITNTIDHRNLDIAKYNTGADIVIQNIDYTNPDIQSAIKVPHVVASSGFRYVEKRFAFIDLTSGQDPANFPTYEIFGVNTSNFAQAAYWESRYSSTDLSTLMTQLEQTTNGIILTTQAAHAQNLKAGDTFAFNYGKGQSRSITFHLVGTVDYFPRLITDVPVPNSDGSYTIKTMYMVMSLPLLNFIVQDGLGGSINPLDKDLSLMYIKTDGTNPRNIAEDINTNLVSIAQYYKITPYTEEKSTVFDIIGNDPEIASIQGKITFLTLHAILLFTIVINLIAIALYSFIFLAKRRKELGVYRALGMTRRQITSLIFFEILLITFTSIFVGIVSGIFVSLIVFRVMLGNLNYVVPSFTLAIPYTILEVVGSLFLAMALFLSFIPAFLNTRKQTGNILRVV